MICLEVTGTDEVERDYWSPEVSLSLTLRVNDKTDRAWAVIITSSKLVSIHQFIRIQTDGCTSNGLITIHLHRITRYHSSLLCSHIYAQKKWRYSNIKHHLKLCIIAQNCPFTVMGTKSCVGLLYWKHNHNLHPLSKLFLCGWIKPTRANYPYTLTQLPIKFLFTIFEFQ